ncbi:hypothetical protein HK101_007137, partial [Irineochytrium annulatum]
MLSSKPNEPSDTKYPQPGQVPKQTQIDQKDGVGIEKVMKPKPVISQQEGPDCTLEEYKAADKLVGRAALVTGGDSGIGRAAAVMFAKEGADVAIVYLPKEEEDAQEAKQLIEAEGRKCVLLPYDITSEENCKKIVEETVQQLGHLDILVNNSAVQ